MIIKNKTKRTTLSPHAMFAKTVAEKTKGLIGEKEDKSLVLKTRFGIHTFGMKKDIDVIILNEFNTVVAFQANVCRNRLLFWDPRFNLIIELPKGTIEKSKTSVGDTILFLDDED